MVAEGEWVYSNGHAVTDGAYSNWGEGAPDGGREENCGALQPDATWDDRNCTMQLQFACSRGKGSEQVHTMHFFTFFIVFNIVYLKFDRWLGLSDRGSLNSFHWSDNEPVVFTYWGLGQPSVSRGDGERCVYADSVTGHWTHSSCHEDRGSVCRTDQEISSVPPDQTGCRVDQVIYQVKV